MPVKYGSMPFNKAVDLFRDKLNIPTSGWTDIYEQQHARAFVVAGAMKADLLSDLRSSVDKVVADGISLDEFRKQFDDIVDRHGWGYNGGRNWRTRVIYETNLYQSHQAGRYAQMQQVKRTRPYWRYRHNDAVEHPRPDHLKWNNMVLRADDPWWNTHYPTNGWGCKCFVETLSERDMQRLGKTGPDQAPEIEYEQKTIGINSPNPRTVSVPKGVDPGFAYNPGRAAVGEQLADNVMADWNKTRSAWKPLNPAGWAEAGRPEQIPMSPLPAKLATKVKTKAEVLTALNNVVGDQKLFKPGNVPLLVDAKALADHLDPSRSEYIPLLNDLLTNPYEVWLSFQQHEGTGKVALRARIIKGYDVGKGRYLLAVANTRKGYLESWTVLPTSDKRYIQRQRQGKLMYAEDE